VPESTKAISVFLLVLALMGVCAVVLGLGLGTYLANDIAGTAAAEAAAGRLDQPGLASRTRRADAIRRAGWFVGVFGLILAAAGTAGYMACRHKEPQD